jgi:hypothetical protein
MSVGISSKSQLFGVLVDERRVGVHGQRRPPDLGFESFLVNAVDERLHVLVAVGVFFGTQKPVPLGGLEAIVHRDPGEP